MYQFGITSEQELYTSSKAKMMEKVGQLSDTKCMEESHKGIHGIYLISVSARILGEKVTLLYREANFFFFLEGEGG